MFSFFQTYIELSEDSGNDVQKKSTYGKAFYFKKIVYKKLSVACLQRTGKKRT